MNKVFAEVKATMPQQISGDGYDMELMLNIKAAVLDLTRTAEIILPGEVDISIDATTGKVTDNSTLDDEYIIQTIALWCDANIGNSPTRDKSEKAYYSRKASMRTSKHYTDFGGGC